MKKIILLLMLPLTVLFAVEFTISTSGTLVPEGVTTIPTTVPNPKFIPNSIDQIWSSAYGVNTEYPATGNSAAGWFNRASGKKAKDQTVAKELVVWTEIESLTSGPITCGPDTSTAKNTVVEMGHLRVYVLKNGIWKRIFNVKNHGGNSYPKSDNDWERAMCDLAGIRDANPGYSVKVGKSPDGFDYYKPYKGYRWHGWGGFRWVPGGTLAQNADAIYVTCKMRLALKDPKGVDDRHLAKYIVHVGADRWVSSSKNLYDLMISKYKRVTNDWVSVSAITRDLTYEQLKSNPPPFEDTP